MLRFITPNLLLLSCLLATVFDAGNLFAEEGIPSPRTLAVLYFTNNSIADRENLESLSKGLADMFITELSKVRFWR